MFETKKVDFNNLVFKIEDSENMKNKFNLEEFENLPNFIAKAINIKARINQEKLFNLNNKDFNFISVLKREILPLVLELVNASCDLVSEVIDDNNNNQNNLNVNTNNQLDSAKEARIDSILYFGSEVSLVNYKLLGI